MTSAIASEGKRCSFVIRKAVMRNGARPRPAVQCTYIFSLFLYRRSTFPSILGTISIKLSWEKSGIGAWILLSPNVFYTTETSIDLYVLSQSVYRSIIAVIPFSVRISTSEMP